MKEIQISQGFVRAVDGEWINIEHIVQFLVYSSSVKATLGRDRTILECDSDEEAQKALDYHMNKHSLD